MPTITATTDLSGRDLLDRILRRLAEAPHTASDPLANPPWLDEYRAAAHADALTTADVQPPSPHRLDAPDRLLLMAAG
ncbi:hypothetical protein ACGFZQ_39000 [Streptomyces sp. NPDC048254]|uniref:hypothetical protein n=1 Tax=Streptomyces sp. NPDC048254 TaxID=3365525 RepID=UPI003712356C